MKTFLEYNKNNNDDAQIKQLAYNIAELGINPLEIIGEMTENIISKLDNKEDKIRIALIEQEIIEGIGSTIGKMAGGIRNAFSDIGKGYKQSRADYQNQQGQQSPPAPQQGQQSQQGQDAQGNNPQANQIVKVLMSFKDNLQKAGLTDMFKDEFDSMQKKLVQIQQSQAQPQAQAAQGQAAIPARLQAPGTTGVTAAPVKNDWPKLGLSQR